METDKQTEANRSQGRKPPRTSLTSREEGKLSEKQSTSCRKKKKEMLQHAEQAEKNVTLCVNVL